MTPAAGPPPRTPAQDRALRAAFERLAGQLEVTSRVLDDAVAAADRRSAPDPVPRRE